MFLCTFFAAVREFVYQIAHYNRKAGPDRLIVNGNEFTETTNFVVAAIISNECSILFETISLIMQREKIVDTNISTTTTINILRSFSIESIKISRRS